MSSTTTTAPNLAGLWIGVGELAAAVQGTWHQAAAAAAGHGDPRPRLQKQRVGGEKAGVKGAVAAAAVGGAAEGDDVVRCGGGAMSDTTLYLLLDRFAPS